MTRIDTAGFEPFFAVYMWKMICMSRCDLVQFRSTHLLPDLKVVVFLLCFHQICAKE